MRYKFNSCFHIVFAFILLLSGPILAQYEGPETGTISGGALVSTDNFTSIPAIGSGEPERKPRLNKERVKLLPDPDDLRQPTGAPGSNEFYDPATWVAELFAPIRINGFKGIPDLNTTIPPDPHMAAGPDHIMGVVNSRLGIYDKKGNLLKLISSANWFANVHSGNPFDPQIVYDHHSQRWVMVWIDYTEKPPRSYLLLSISDDANPLGNWCNWRLPGNQNGSTPNTFLNDYPKLGIDANAIYVTVNFYDLVDMTFKYPQLRIIPKAQLLDPGCGPVTWTDFWDLRDPDRANVRLITLVPAVTFGQPDAEYLICDSRYESGTFMTLWQVFDPIGQPALFAQNIPVTAAVGWPSNADQLDGSTTRIEVGGRAVRNAVYMDGHLWTAHSVAGGKNRAFAFARYVKIDVQNLKTVEDVAFGADNFWYYFPAIHPDGNGNVFMVFTRSGLTEYPSLRYTGRLKNAAPGLQASALLKAGEANYVKTFGGERNRWGDYTGIALDPSDSTRIWMFGEYAVSPANTWGTWFGQATLEPVPGQKITSEPQFFRFDTLEVGQKSPITPVVIANIGTEPVTIDSVYNRNGSFQITGLPKFPVTLKSFEEFELTAQFVPVAPRLQTDTIFVFSNAANNRLFSVPLTGFAFGTAVFQGSITDSLNRVPVRASLEFTRQGESQPRALVQTDSAGFYQAEVLEGSYDIVIRSEIPYPELRLADVSHTLAGTRRNYRLMPARIVIVEDDSTGEAGPVYRELLDQMGYAYSVWNRDETGETVPVQRLPLLAAPKIVLWATGSTVTEVLTPEDRAVLVAHLRAGNTLLLTGDNIAETAPTGDTLLSQFFGVEFAENYFQVVMRGVAGDPIGDGVITGAAGLSKDQLRLTGTAAGEVHKVLSYGLGAADSTRIAAVRAHNDSLKWKAVFMAFRLEETTLRNRRMLLQRSIDWLSTETPVTAVPLAEASNVPRDFSLEQNHPNPFNPVTRIAYTVPTPAWVTIQVYNLVGQEVMTLVNAAKAPGRFTVELNASNLAGGLYFYRMQAGNFVAARKLIVLK